MRRTKPSFGHVQMEYQLPALFKRTVKEFEDADAAHRAAEKEYNQVNGDADATASVKP
jgi:hypothetical protein